MKRTFRYLSGMTVIAAAIAFGPLARAQTAVTETTTTSANGTISEFTPGSDTIVVHREGSTEPLRYTYSKSTTFVDDAGNPVDISVVKSGLPVEVYYEREGDGMIARKVVVHRAPAIEHRETTTTTTTTNDRHDDLDKDRDHPGH